MHRDTMAEPEIEKTRSFDPDAIAEGSSSRLAGLASLALTIATIVAIVIAAHKLSFSEILGLLPSKPAFWLVFAAFYLIGPVTEWILFHRLWNMPSEGFVALLRKYVLNEIVLGYLGEAKFYAWARTRLQMQTAPFAAIKDVSILSAMAGNVMTLIMLAAAWPLLHSSAIGLDLRSSFLSLGVVLASSFVVLLFRRMLFSLPARELWFISCVHVARIVVSLLLTALMWHLVLPEVGVSTWLLLATLRMLVSRLPLVANKELVFATLALFMLGSEAQLASMLAMVAGLVLVTHIVVGTLCALGEIATVGKR